MSKLYTTSVTPSYTYCDGKLTILNHEEYRKLKKHNRLIRKVLKEQL